MKVTHAEFIVSNTQVANCPKHTQPEYAFIGRSNVGKSSLINALTQRKNLAKTSGKPGKTQLINHFLINKSWYLVDLPGYGYAKVSKTQKATFQKYITSYFLKRKQLVSAFVLLDSRHAPQQIDLEFISWMGKQQIPFALVFTKADKLTEKILEDNMTAYKNELLTTWEALPPFFITSATKGMGTEALLEYIATINGSLT